MRTIEDLFSLRGKVALVTGASTGLGVEFAKALAMAGADVALVARRRDKLEEVAALLRERGVKSAVVAADLRVDADIVRVVAETEKQLGAIDILVNNAGVAPLGRAERYSRNKWDVALQVNLTAAFRLCQETANRMITRGAGGRIINITSILATGANPIYYSAGYVAAKAGLTNLTRQLATEWAKHGITVNAIAPAWFPTEMTELGFSQAEYKLKAESLTPLGRLGDPAEVQTALLFLASPASSYVTGSTVYVDGGWTAW